MHLKLRIHVYHFDMRYDMILFWHYEWCILDIMLGAQYKFSKIFCFCCSSLIFLLLLWCLEVCWYDGCDLFLENKMIHFVLIWIQESLFGPHLFYFVFTLMYRVTCYLLSTSAHRAFSSAAFRFFAAGIQVDRGVWKETLDL